jgi:hypothetical protein
MLKWHHLKVEFDNRERQWPEGSEYEFDHEKQTVTWFLRSQSQAPDRLVCHLTREELWSPKPFDVADRIIKWANKMAKGED